MLARHLTSRNSDIMLHMMGINGPMHLHLTLQNKDMPLAHLHNRNIINNMELKT